MERHFHKKERRASGKNHLKGPRKRTAEDDERFEQSFEKMVLMRQIKKKQESEQDYKAWRVVIKCTKIILKIQQIDGKT